jgi:hypothetical protein
MLLTWSKAVYDANHNDLRIGLRELKRSLNAAPAQIGIRNALADDLLELRSKEGLEFTAGSFPRLLSISSVARRCALSS